jgi:3'-phosphoadenosine 5'-phosphosulfate sulfotransferase (PAPS reductase)/FAD synthetase
MEYVFCDTGEELPGTKDYLLKIQAHLGRDIEILNPERPFGHYLELYRGVLPDPRTRWCTRMLKIRPFEKYVGSDPVALYVGIRADESHRKGYVSTKPNITPYFPFIEDGIRKKDVMDILAASGLGLPDYYRWRSRSGCYFCFFQQRREWVGLLENHEPLFRRAAGFEKTDPDTGTLFTWIQNESLAALSQPERIEAIKREHAVRMDRERRSSAVEAPLLDVFAEEEALESSCLICHL